MLRVRVDVRDTDRVRMGQNSGLGLQLWFCLGERVWGGSGVGVPGRGVLEYLGEGEGVPGRGCWEYV